MSSLSRSHVFRGGKSREGDIILDGRKICNRPIPVEIYTISPGRDSLRVAHIPIGKMSDARNDDDDFCTSQFACISCPSRDGGNALFEPSTTSCVCFRTVEHKIFRASSGNGYFPSIKRTTTGAATITGATAPGATTAGATALTGGPSCLA